MSIIKQIEVGREKIEVISLADLGLRGYSTFPNHYKAYVISEKGFVYFNKQNGKFERIGIMMPSGHTRVNIACNTFYVDDLHKKALPLFEKAKAA